MAVKQDALAASGLKELSMCQRSFPRNIQYGKSLSSTTSPFERSLEMAASGVSNSPKREAKAICTSSDRACSGKMSTPNSRNACLTMSQLVLSKCAKSMPVIVAPSVASLGSILIGMERILALIGAWAASHLSFAETVRSGSSITP